MGKKLLGGLLLGATLYCAIRYLGERWGATNAEVATALPGDEIVCDPNTLSTHAVTIEVPPSQVWPWLAQAGHRGAGRAGWYTDAWWDPFVDRFVLPLMVPAKDLPEPGWYHSADHIIPEFQHPAVGDVVPDGPPGTAWFTIREVERERSLVLYSDSHVRYMSPKFLQGTRWAASGPFTWVFALSPVGDSATRLVLRTRAELRPHVLLALVKPFFYLADFLLARQLLLGLKRRAEKPASQ
jgi:hypothetical protein